MPANEHQVVKAKRPLMDKEVLRDLPAHYLEAQRGNASLEACCRNSANLSVEWHKTDATLEKANKLVISCTCGRKHVRFAGGSAEVKS